MKQGGLYIRERFSASQSSGTRQFAQTACGREPIVAPGAYDALTARIVEQAGFPAVYMTGFGTSASLLGRPDVGLLTMSQMVDNARRIARAVDLPVIADADTGYGNPLNVIHTVQEYERAGVSAIHIEDQVMPKKCGHMENKQVVSGAEMAEKIRAAMRRGLSDFLIIARTDARAVEGLESALRRARPIAKPAPTCCLWKRRRAKKRSPRSRVLSRTCRCYSTGRRAARLRRCRWSG